MPMLFRIFGSVDSIPTMDEIIETLEEAEFDVTLESEDDDEESWTEIQVYEASIEGPITVFRYVESDVLADELDDAIDSLKEDGSDEANAVEALLQNFTVGFGIDLPDELAEEENGLVLASVMAQFLAQRCDGLYSVDSEAWFNESGELIMEFAEED